MFYRLKNDNSLRKHLARHKRISCVCPICNKVIPNKYDFSKHKQDVHSDIAYTCSICNKKFKRSVNLREHMAIHTGEDLYTCPYCPKTFKSNANMHSHRKKVHPVEWLQNRKEKQNL